jgi:hypothetical protein
MAVAAPKRRSSVAPAPAPSRTTAPKRTAPPKRTSAPKRKKAPSSRAATRSAPRGRAAAAPATAPARRAPARAPQRARPRPKRATGGQPSLAIAVGRTAATVRHLPDSGLIVRMTRSRAWIAVLGILLVGIVALNVVTLSFAASSGKIDEQITTYEEENSTLDNRLAQKLSSDRIHGEAASQGLAMPVHSEPQVIQFTPHDISTAAQRLAAAG